MGGSLPARLLGLEGPPSIHPLVSLEMGPFSCGQNRVENWVAPGREIQEEDAGQSHSVLSGLRDATRKKAYLPREPSPYDQGFRGVLILHLLL